MYAIPDPNQIVPTGPDIAPGLPSPDATERMKDSPFVSLRLQGHMHDAIRAVGPVDLRDFLGAVLGLTAGIAYAHEPDEEARFQTAHACLRLIEIMRDGLNEDDDAADAILKAEADRIDGISEETVIQGDALRDAMVANSAAATDAAISKLDGSQA